LVAFNTVGLYLIHCKAEIETT